MKNYSCELNIYSPVFDQNIKGKFDYIYRNSVLVDKFFDFNVCKTICEYLVDGTDFIDIGANIGLVTLGVKQLLKINNKPDFIRKYHCFECNVETFGYLKYNISEHNNVTTYNFGISDKAQIGNMSINNFNYGNNFVKTIYDDEKDGCKTIKNNFEKNGDYITDYNTFVSFFPLDFFINIFENRVSVIKIDVEGFEDNVLSGAKHFLEKHKPTIIVEINEENLTKIKELMKSYNYDCKGLINGEKEYINEDYLFVYNYLN